MKEFPRITYKESSDYTKEDLDEIFEKLLKYETDYSSKLVEIRKEQILKHSQGYSIARCLNELANLIGRECHYAEPIMEHVHKELIELHSPVIFNIQINLEPFHKWETWTFAELYDHYIFLATAKGWEDYYSLVNDFSKNKRVGKYGLEDFDIDYNLIKNYHVLDMLNDLILNDYKICGYELRSFMNLDVNNRLLQTFNQDSLIEVKLPEKMTIEERKESLGIGKCRVSNYYPPSAWHKTGVRCIARLDGDNPVKIMNNKYAIDICVGDALNLFDIVELYKQNIPDSEDWYVAHMSGFNFNEDLRNRNIRKYTKGMVYYMMMRLATHDIFKCFSRKDIIKNSWKGEINSFFRPYQTVHICYKPRLCDL